MQHKQYDLIKYLRIKMCYMMEYEATYQTKGSMLGSIKNKFQKNFKGSQIKQDDYACQWQLVKGMSERWIGISCIIVPFLYMIWPIDTIMENWAIQSYI